MTERRRNLLILLIVLGLIGASIAVVATKGTKLGLDLQGGVSLVYQGKPTKQQTTVDPESLDRAVDIIRERVDALGVAEPQISRSGADQIEVDLPAVQDAERAAQQVGSTAQLYFYDWEKNVLDRDCKTNPDEVNGGTAPINGLYNAVQAASKCQPYKAANTTNASQERWYGFDKVNKPVSGGIPETKESELWSEEPGGKKPAGYKAVKVPEGILIVRGERSTDSKGKPGPRPDAWWIMRDSPALSGTDIKNPEQNFDDQTNAPNVRMEFTDKGKREFQQVTREIAQRGADNAFPGTNPTDASQHFAIVLDNDLVSTPFINFRENPDGIDGETGAEISGGFTIQSAQDLANFLKIGALPIQLELISRSQVSATLGKQALDQGLTAGIVGFAIVAIFLVAFYRVLGVIAVMALFIYALYFYALVKLIPVVLTLPGNAGLILGLGVAADANIVIFDRVKEEIRRGRSTGAAIVEGFKKGFSTIVDANVVTLLVAFILFILASAGVRGFALMLGLGAIVSLFTAVLATQAVLLTLRNTKLLKSKSALGAQSERVRWRIDFMGWSRYFFSMSGVILLIGAFSIAGNGLKFGIDFESGTRIRASLEQPATVEQVRNVLEQQGLDSPEVQSVQDPQIGNNVVQISTSQLEPPEVDRVENALDSNFGLAQSSSTSIGPTFGQSIANSALVAIIASLSVISIYIALRFQWKFAVPVLIALMHDILITAGVYALVGREVTASTVAALLTILGFSLYDTIIVFDRIRENMPRMPNATYSQIVNRSMSEVLTRSLATSFSTLLPVLALFLFGGETLQDFAFALMVGIASGAYSSVFIASPLLVHWKEREPVFRARRRRVIEEFGFVPAFAVATAGAPVDVAPRERKRRQVAADPSQGVSQEEFDDLVANLGVENRPVVAPPRQAPGGRRARSRAGGGDGAPGDGGSGRGGGGSDPPDGGGGAAGAGAGGAEAPGAGDAGEGEGKGRRGGSDARKERRKHGRTR